LAYSAPDIAKQYSSAHSDAWRMCLLWHEQTASCKNTTNK